MKNQSQAARVAQVIRGELKEKFSKIKFSVKSERNTVRIEYEDGPKSDDVENAVCKYEAGHFDGMIDCYEFKPNPENIERVMYIFISRNLKEETRMKIEKDIAEKFGIKNIDDDNEWFEIFGSWKNQVIYQKSREMSF